MTSAAGFEVFDDLFARGKAIQSLVFAGVFVHCTVVVHDAHDGQVVAQADLEVVGVVRGRDLHRARAEFQIDVVVGDDRDLAPDERENERLADHMLVPLVLGVDGDGRIAEHRFGAGRRDDDELVAVLDGVFEVPEEGRVLAVLHFRVGEGGLAAGAPVDDAVAAIDQALVIEVDEHFAHGAGAVFVHREGEAGPVRRDAHLLELLDDAAAVFLLPLPGAAQEAFAPDLLFGEAFLLHLLDDLDLRRDGRVVAAGEIEGGIPLHTLEADEGVDDGVVQRMAQVQLPRDVGGRDDDGEGDLVLVRLGAEIARVHPVLVQPLLEIFGIVCLLHFHIPPFPARPLPARTGLFAPKNAHTAQFYL